MDPTLIKIIDHLKYTEQYRQTKKIFWNDFVSNYRDILQHENMARFTNDVILPRKS